MTATTAKGTPYIEDTDAVADYPAASQQLATEVDTRLPFAIHIGRVVLGANGVGTLTFPAGKFTAPPKVFLAIESGAMPSSPAGAYVGTVTAANVTVRGNSGSAPTGGALTVDVLAIQLDA